MSTGHFYIFPSSPHLTPLTGGHPECSDWYSTSPSPDRLSQKSADPERGKAERPSRGNTVPPPDRSSFNCWETQVLV